MSDPVPSENDKLQFSWRVEAAQALLWAVGLTEVLSYPSELCDWNAFWERFHSDHRETFLSRLSLRPQSELLDEADLIYRLHWAARDASLTRKTVPAGLNLSIVMERDFALNWLTAYAEEPTSWDETDTST